MIVLMIPILAIVLDSDLGKAIARRLERGSPAEGSEHTHDRLVYLESELERLGKGVERLEEESRFLHNLLADRPEAGRLAPGDRTTRDQGGAGQAPESPGSAGKSTGRRSSAG